MKLIAAITALISLCFGLEVEAIKGTLAQVTDRVFFDIEINGEATGRVIFGMFGVTTPKTARNFIELSDASNPPISSTSGSPITYKGSVFHRIIADFMAQGGDITSGNGTGGDSIYGSSFEDENFTLSFTQKYLLAMANRGPNTNTSQFFITYENTDWLNGKHTIFGQVLEGHEVVDKMVGHGGKVVISDCGIL